VLLPTGERYYTVLGHDDLRVREADQFLFQHLAQGGAEGTTESYAGAIALFLTWCTTSGLVLHETACQAVDLDALGDDRKSRELNEIILNRYRRDLGRQSRRHPRHREQPCTQSA